jgi:hypothetical protein
MKKKGWKGSVSDLESLSLTVLWQERRWSPTQGTRQRDYLLCGRAPVAAPRVDAAVVYSQSVAVEEEQEEDTSREEDDAKLREAVATAAAVLLSLAPVRRQSVHFPPRGQGGWSISPFQFLGRVGREHGVCGVLDCSLECVSFVASAKRC